MTKVKVGITIGDINGIGPEIIINALSNRRILNHCIPIIYGSAKVLSYYKKAINKHEFNFINVQDAAKVPQNKISVINCWEEMANIQQGMISEEGGKFAKIALDAAINDAKEGKIDAIVTAPIHKKSMEKSGFKHLGHTGYLAEQFGTSHQLMMMVSDNFRVGLVTEHIPVKEVASKITKELLASKILAFHKSLKKDFGIGKPTIAVLGLNPHAGDEGLMGKEEIELIKPVIQDAKRNDMQVMGPFSADGFFGSNKFTKVDGILAMYHDQGLIPFKALSFGHGVNFTAGLKVVRTSPDHGTAFDIVGKGKSDAASMRNAIYTAIDLVRNRNMKEEIIEEKKPRPSENIEE